MSEPGRDERDLSIVMVTMNNRRYLEPCLESLYREPLGCSFDLVVVDNGSSDGTPDWLRTQYPDAIVIENGENVGLSRASNQGIQATRSRYVLLLNDDTLVSAADLHAMVEFLDRTPDAGAAGGRLLNADGSVQSCYNHFSTLREELLIATRAGEALWAGYPSRVNETRLREVDWISSACLMLRRATLDEVGLLDETYFIYGDEADLQYRLSQAGWKVYFLPHVNTVHFGGRSLNRWRRRRMVYRGKLLFYQKHYSALSTTALRIMLATLSVGKMACWAGAYVVPGYRERAGRELASNVEVVRVCRDLR